MWKIYVYNIVDGIMTYLTHRIFNCKHINCLKHLSMYGHL